MHAEDGGETLWRMAALGHVEIAMQGIAKFRMGAVLDDELGALGRILPRRSATPCSVTMTCTECSLWSAWLTSGTIVLILPPSGRGQVKIEMKALRVKSPDPPMPFMMLRPMIWVLFTLPNRSVSIAVLIEIRPSRRMISAGWRSPAGEATGGGGNQ